MPNLVRSRDISRSARPAPVVLLPYLGSSGRLATAVGILLLYLAFEFLPAYLAFADKTQEHWALTWWVVSPLFAAAVCAFAARKSTSHDRKAFWYFAIAGVLWAAGTLIWQFIDTDALQQPFPGWADVAYFGTCACFLIGVFEYSATDKPITRLQVCTFVLAQAAIAICIFFLLVPDMKNSALTSVGTFVAYLYPVVWGGAAAFATFCFFLYAQVSRRFTVGLLLAGLVAQGAADTFYALDLMGATYSVGSLFDGLWVLAFLLIAWAAVDI